MNHLQTRINMDGTLCLDYYDTELYSSDTVKTISNAAKYLEKHSIATIRRFPFYVTECIHCKHPIITNRDYYDEIVCQNCGMLFKTKRSNDDIDKILLNNIHKALGYNIQECIGHIAYLLIIAPEFIDSSKLQIIHNILTKFGFSAELCEGNIFQTLLQCGKDRGWIGNNNIIYLEKIILDDNDCILDNTVPRVEACSRFIRKQAQNQIKTISTHIPPKISYESRAKTKEEMIRNQINKLVSEGKMTEALKYVDEY